MYWSNLRIGQAIVAKAPPIPFAKDQVWRSGRKKVHVLKKWDRLWVIKDQYGDQNKVREDDLRHLLQKGNYKLEEPLLAKKLLNILQYWLPILLGFSAGRTLVKKIERVILSHVEVVATDLKEPKTQIEKLEELKRKRELSDDTAEFENEALDNVHQILLIMNKVIRKALTQGDPQLRALAEGIVEDLRDILNLMYGKISPGPEP